MVFNNSVKITEMAEAKVPVTMRDFFFDDPFFKRSWDDFDKVRDAMFNESRDMWKRFDEDFGKGADSQLRPRPKQQRTENKERATCRAQLKNWNLWR